MDFATEMQTIQSELSTLMEQEAKNTVALGALFAELGFPLNTSADA